jgi:hypothetical protein
VNAPATGTSRRRFLTRLFTDPDSNPAACELRPLEDLRQHTEGVLCALTESSGSGKPFRRSSRYTHSATVMTGSTVSAGWARSVNVWRAPGARYRVGRMQPPG